MSTPARPVRATINIDRLTSPIDLTDLAQFDHQLEGTQPYVRFFRVDVSCAPADLLPPEAEIERCVTNDTAVVVLARLADACVHVAAFPRSVMVRVTATSHERAESLADAVRARAPVPSAGAVNLRV